MDTALSETTSRVMLPTELVEHIHYFLVIPLKQELLQEIKAKVEEAVPCDSSYIVRKKGWWKRGGSSSFKDCQKVSWGLAVKGYRKYIAFSTYDQDFFHFQNNSYGHSKCQYYVGWDEGKPWRDVWRDTSDYITTPKNMWNQFLPQVFPRVRQLPAEIQDLCYYHCYSMAFKKVLQELVQQVEKAVPKKSMKLWRKGMRWKRDHVNREKDHHWTRTYEWWGLAKEGYQDYVATTVCCSVTAERLGFEWNRTNIQLSNEEYEYTDEPVKWDMEKPWRDVWYFDRATPNIARNQWHKPLPTVFA